MAAEELANNRDRCVGPARMIPLLSDAFDAGIAADGPPLVNAARIEAGLLWFLALSPYKECNTCADAPQDCDSCWAYYSGARQRAEDALGLGGYVATLDRETHDRAIDGFLAVDCWRDLDQAVPAADLALRDLAVGQMDRAILRGVALVVVDRLETLRAAAGDEREAAWAFIEILGPFLDREAESRDPDAAASLAAAWAAGPDAIDIDATVCDLQTVFHCP